MGDSETAENDKSKKAMEGLLEAVSGLQDRIDFAKRHGLSFDGDRDIYQELGYDREPKVERYWEMYSRQDIAGFIVDKAPETTWKNPPKIEGMDTEKFINKVRLWSNLMKVDKISRIGKYGVLLLGFDDSEDFSKPVEGKNNDLLYLQPYPSIGVDIDSMVEDETDERYGKPEMYSFEPVKNENIEDFNFEVDINEIHWSRVIHVTENNLVSNIIGRPHLERIYNRLRDLQKVVGSTAEAFWKEVDPAWDVNVDESANLSEDDVDELRKEIKNVVHGLQRVMAGQGRDIKKITADIKNPENPFDVIMSLIASGTIYTKRQLTGSERGELASTMDQQTYYGAISERQTWHAEPEILRPTLDRLKKYGAIPEGDYEIEWPNLFELTRLEEAKVANNIGSAAKNLGQAVTQGILSQEQAMELLGIESDGETLNQNTIEELEAIRSMLDEKIDDRKDE